MQGEDGVCEGFAGVLEAYAAVTPNVKMSGPTCFAPVIHKAMEIVARTNKVRIRKMEQSELLELFTN